MGRIRIIVIEGDGDAVRETARALSEAGIWDSTLAGIDVLPERLLGPPDRDIVFKDIDQMPEPFVEAHRPERDWKQRERQRPGRRKRR
jgi:hypothetical protein